MQRSATSQRGNRVDIAGNDIGTVRPTILPLGDNALLVRFGDTLSDAANRAAIALALSLADEPLPGVIETVPNLVSVLLRYDPVHTQLSLLAGALRLRLYGLGDAPEPHAGHHTIAVRFDGPDLEAVAAALRMTMDGFVEAHDAVPLRVLATGFAPGFVYCGFHPPSMHLPRRGEIRQSVPPGTVLFAAGQTAIAATTIPTGWHVIGSTDFRNFDASASQPTRLRAGDLISFERMP
jgi:KipI family sensor histidine kinase inhibitor